MVKSGKYDVIICLGCVIRGVIFYYDYVCSEVFKGIVKVFLDSELFVIFGIVIIENIE